MQLFPQFVPSFLHQKTGSAALVARPFNKKGQGSTPAHDEAWFLSKVMQAELVNNVKEASETSSQRQQVMRTVAHPTAAYILLAAGQVCWGKNIGKHSKKHVFPECP